VVRSKSPAAFTARDRITAPFSLTLRKEFYEYSANHTINLSPPSDLVGRWPTTVGGAIDRLGGNASPPKWKQYYNIQSALNGGSGWYKLS